MPIDRRLELLRFSEVHWRGTDRGRLRQRVPLRRDDRSHPCKGSTAAGRIFYLGTFSKVMLADIRVGYTVVPESPWSEPSRIAQRHTGQLVSRGPCRMLCRRSWTTAPMPPISAA